MSIPRRERRFRPGNGLVKLTHVQKVAILPCQATAQSSPVPTVAIETVWRYLMGKLANFLLSIVREIGCQQIRSAFAISPDSSRANRGRVAYALGGSAIVLDWIADESIDGAIRIIDEQVLASESDTVLRLFFQDHKTILATTARNQLIKWELSDQWRRNLFSGQPKPLKIVRPLPDGREVWTASGRDTIMTWCLHTSQSLIELPIIDVGHDGNIQIIGREVTGNINNQKLFWQPLLTRWPSELDHAWEK
jgi:hypothetical protein